MRRSNKPPLNFSMPPHEHRRYEARWARRRRNSRMWPMCGDRLPELLGEISCHTAKQRQGETSRRNATAGIPWRLQRAVLEMDHNGTLRAGNKPKLVVRGLFCRRHSGESRSSYQSGISLGLYAPNATELGHTTHVVRTHTATRRRYALS
jgi:hypothetical protein